MERSQSTSSHSNPPMVVLSNSQYIHNVLSLSREVHADCAVRVRISPPIRRSPFVQLHFTPLHQQAFAALPSPRHFDKWTLSRYSSKDAVDQLWVSLYHMIVERGQTRLLGNLFPNESLHSRCVRLLQMISEGRNVFFYFTSVYAADEFPPVSASSNQPALAKIGAAIDRLRAFADSRGRNLPFAILSSDVVNAVSRTSIGTSAVLNPCSDGYIINSSSWNNIFMLLLDLRVRAALYLRTLADWFGPSVAAEVAVIGSVPEIQQGVTDLSYARFTMAKGGKGDKISLAVSAKVLRKTGKLREDDNLFLGEGTMGVVVCVGTRWIVQPLDDPSMVMTGRIPDEVMVC